MSNLVSILIPVYNSEKWLKECLDSIINQTYKNLEIILVDDGSTDNSLKILKEYEKNDKRIRIFEEEHKGIVEALNKGLENCNGKYIARMDSDDISLPQRIEKQVEYMENNFDCVVLGTNYSLIDEDSMDIKRPTNSFQNDLDLRTCLFFFSPFLHPSIMLRNDILRTNNLKYLKELEYLEDRLLYVQLSRLGKLHNLKEKLVKYRIVSTSITRTVHKNISKELLLKRKLLVEKIYKTLNIELTLEEKILLVSINLNGKISKEVLKTFYEKIKSSSIELNEELLLDIIERIKVG